MNITDFDTTNITPEKYLKMVMRCGQLEKTNELAGDTILELKTSLDRNHEMAEYYQKEAEGLRKSLNEVNQSAQKWYDEAQCLGREIIRCKAKCDELQQELNDADAKIQSANDRAANAKKEAKQAKERAESTSERVRYLERKLRDVESLNDSLMKELARRQFNIARDEAVSEIREHDADVYQLDVLKYAPDYSDRSINLSYAVIGLCGEAGEASEIVKKFVYHGHTIDPAHLARELGDVLWYAAYTAHLFGYSLSKIMAMNREKLAKRYPEGKFDAERSRNREEGDI